MPLNFNLRSFSSAGTNIYVDDVETLHNLDPSSNSVSDILAELVLSR